MISLEVVGAGEFATHIREMIGRISHFANIDMANEFAGWQREDMHRKHAAVKKSSWWNHKRSASTTIRPHSRYEMARSHAYQQRLRKRLGRGKKGFVAPSQLRHSTRPILRESLDKQFHDRLTQLFFEKIHW